MSKSNRYVPKLDTDLISLRSLVAIAEEGTFSAAARRVGRTQSAVSLQIAKLEDHINAKLFERTSRKVTLTETGEKFLAYAQRIIDLADEAMASISAPDVHAVLRIGFADYLVPKHLHALIQRFKRAHPKVDLKLSLGSSLDFYKQMSEGELDIVVAGPEFEGGQVLLKEPLVWVGSKNHHVAKDVSLVLMPPPCSYRKAAYDSLTAENFRFDVSMEASSINGVQSAVAAELGISVMAKSAVADNLEILENMYPELPSTSIVGYVRPGATQALADRFLTFFMESLASHGIS